MKRQITCIIAAATLFTLFAASPAKVSAQSAGSWVDIARGSVGSGASADGLFKIAKNKSSSKNGVDFGHGFALGAGPDGIAISNSIGVGGGQAGAAHNVQLNIGRNGTHISHGGVVSQGGNRRVITGGETGTSNGIVYGGSQSTGYGQNTKTYSKSHTRQWGSQVYQNQPNYGPNTYNQPTYSQPASMQRSNIQPSFSRSGTTAGRVIRTSGMRMFGR